MTHTSVFLGTTGFLNTTVLLGPRKTQLARIHLGDEELLLDVENLALVRGSSELIDALVSPAQNPEFKTLRAPFLQPSAAPPDLGQRPISKLTIGNTLRCNLRCSYCYNGSEAAAQTPIMSPETGRQAVTALLQQDPLPSHLALLFIGGESLLDRKGVETLLDHARKQAQRKNIDVEAVLYTNGVLMDAKTIAWAEDRGISLIVSLDGPPRQHDRFRVFANGQGSANIVLKNIHTLMQQSRARTRRVRAVSQPGGDLLALHRYLFALGFNDIYVQSLFDEQGYNDKIEQQDLTKLVAWYKSLLLKGIVISVHPFETILTRLSQRGRGSENWVPCSAAIDSLGLNHDGKLVPCHHFFAEPGQRIAHVDHGIPKMSERRPYFFMVHEREPCASCWARHLCGGECYHRALTAGLDYHAVVERSCDRKRVEIALALDLWSAIATLRPSVLSMLQSFELTRPSPQPQAFAAEDLGAFINVKG